MAAKDHLHPGQLQMFMTPGQLKALKPGDAEGYASHEEMWKDKSYASHSVMHNDQPNLATSVRNEGVKEPVLIAHHDRDGSFLWDGHHRTQSADEAGTPYVPVLHEDITHPDYHPYG